MAGKLNLIYSKLYHYFGPQHWWPGRSPFEVILGAILTQNTNWSNVEKAINNLRKHGLLNPHKLYRLKQARLASLIRPAGYFNVKAKRLKAFLDFFMSCYKADTSRMAGQDALALRHELLAVNGIGPETADSILLYALNKPVFVIDAYTRRVFCRHGFIAEAATYQELQDLFMCNLKKDAALFNEYHALIVRLGKEYCRKSKPRCQTCPLKAFKRRKIDAG